jgi:hypothetical protein
VLGSTLLVLVHLQLASAHTKVLATKAATQSRSAHTKVLATKAALLAHSQLASATQSRSTPLVRS